VLKHRDSFTFYSYIYLRYDAAQMATAESHFGWMPNYKRSPCRNGASKLNMCYYDSKFVTFFCLIRGKKHLRHKHTHSCAGTVSWSSRALLKRRRTLMKNGLATNLDGWISLRPKPTLRYNLIHPQHFSGRAGKMHKNFQDSRFRTMNSQHPEYIDNCRLVWRSVMKMYTSKTCYK
jgi:hypothetical protein